jgi:hypothetical protein
VYSTGSGTNTKEDMRIGGRAMVLMDIIMYQEMIGTGKLILLILIKRRGPMLPLIPGHIQCLIIMAFWDLIGIPDLFIICYFFYFA